MTQAARFKAVDLSRAYKALTGAGMRVGRVEIDPNGKIVILPETAIATARSDGNEWDEVFEEAPAPAVRKRVR